MTDAPPPASPQSPDLVSAVAPIADDKAAAFGTRKNPYIWGTGRRKWAVARVRVRPGPGKFLVNNRDVGEFFRLEKDRKAVSQPLQVTEATASFDVLVTVHGGGVSGQAGAVVLGLARALVKVNPDFEPKLREHRLLTRDARKVERKKYGQSGARRRFQFSKR